MTSVTETNPSQKPQIADSPKARRSSRLQGRKARKKRSSNSPTWAKVVKDKLPYKAVEAAPKKEKDYKKIADHLKSEILRKARSLDNLSMRAISICDLVTRYFDGRVQEAQSKEECEVIEFIMAEVQKVYTLLDPPKQSDVKNEVNNNPTSNEYILPEAKELAHSLEKLFKKLESYRCYLNTPNLRPKNACDEEGYKKSIQKLQLVEEKIETLRPALVKKLKKLDATINNARRHTIPEEHWESISLYRNMPLEKVRQEIEQFQSIHQKRKDLFDELSSQWAYALIRLEKACWKKQQIQITESTYRALQELAENLATHKKSIETLKTNMRTQLNDTPEENHVLLINFEKEIDRLIKEYETLSERAKSLEENTLKTIVFLDPERISQEIEEKVSEINPFTSIYRETIKNFVLEEIEDTYKKIRRDTKSLFHQLTTEWESIKSMINGELQVQINRIAYAIKENGGSIPLQKTFDYWYYSSANYVNSPFVEEEVVDNSPQEPDATDVEAEEA